LQTTAGFWCRWFGGVQQPSFLAGAYAVEEAADGSAVCERAVTVESGDHCGEAFGEAWAECVVALERSTAEDFDHLVRRVVADVDGAVESAV